MLTLQEAAEELYALPLDQFIPRRNDLAKELRSQDRELAEAVRRLPKPSQAAWTLNTYSRRRPKQLDELLSLGEQLREAQEDLAGDALRELTQRARPAVRGAGRAAAEVAGEHDVTLGESAERQVEQTLRAALADEHAAQALRSGVLTRALKPGGFGDVDVEGALAVTQPGATATTPKAKKKKSTRDREQRREARQAAKAALTELKKADSELRRQEERLKQLQEDASAAQSREQALREELGQAQQQASQAADAAREARRERDAARTAQRAAARRGQRAQKRLDKLS